LQARHYIGVNLYKQLHTVHIRSERSPQKLNNKVMRPHRLGIDRQQRYQ